MQHPVEMVGVLAEALGEGVEVLLVGDVELDDDGRRGQAPGDRLGDLHGPPKRREDHRRALLLRQLGDVEGDRAVHEDACHEQCLAVE